jgi:RNA processing factor Prp31
MEQELIIQAKKDIQKSLMKDQLIIFFTRIIEDIENKKDEYSGRVKDLYLVLDPYGISSKDANYLKAKNSQFEFEYGLQLDYEEKEMLRRTFMGLQEDFSFKDYNTTKGVAVKSLLNLNQKYLPNSSMLIEPFILGKLVSFFGGINNLYRKPAGTIQLIGAEKAFFRHKAISSYGPKYGFIFKSKSIQASKEKGKAARQLANQLSQKIKIDYFQNFAR